MKGGDPMQDEKKQEIRKNLENFQQQLSDMKKVDPSGDYSEIEKIIYLLSTMLKEVDQKHFFLYFIFRRIAYIFLHLVIYIASICVVFGFTFSMLSMTDYTRLWYLIPITALALLIVNKIIMAGVSTLSPKKPLMSLLFWNLLVVLTVSALDDMIFHMFKSFIYTFIFLWAVIITASIGEYYLYKKWSLF